MSVLGNNYAGVAGDVNAAGVDSLKARKLESLKKWKAKKIEAAKAAHESSLVLRDELVKAGLLDRLTAASKAFVLQLCQDPAQKSAASNSPVLNMLYGSSPKVGDKITLAQAFQKTAKGKSTLDIWIKRQIDKGIVIECIQKENIMDTEYEIKALPGA